MKQLILDVYDTQELMDKNINLKDVIENLKLIKQEQEKMVTHVVKALLAPVVCPYDIDIIEFEFSSDGVSDNIKVFIDSIDCHKNNTKIKSLDLSHETTYEKIQNDIYSNLEYVFFNLMQKNKEYSFNIIFLRKEHLYSDLNQKITKNQNHKNGKKI